MTHPATYVVGVDGSAGSTAAVRYAAHEASRDHGLLRLVHVVPSFVPLSPMSPLVPVDLQGAGVDAGTTVLDQARAVACEQVDPDRVSVSLVHGPRIPALVGAAREAHLLVLGHRQGASPSRIVTGATVTAAASRSSCPVVAVAADHAVGDGTGQVLVGVEDVEHCRHLVRRGFQVAAERHARLVLLHAWELGRVYDDLVAHHTEVPAWEARSRAVLEQEVELVGAEFPGVPAEVRVVHGQAASALCQATRASDLVLLARRAHAFPVGHVGGTARALLHHSRCPVSLEPRADDQPGPPDLELETAGGLLR